MIKIEMNTNGFKPEENYSYVLGKGGIYLFKENFLYSARIKLNKEDMPKLQKVKEKIELNIKRKIPFAEVKGLEKFFKDVKRMYDKEAFASILYHPEKEEFTFYIPHQKASAVGVHTEEYVTEKDGFIPCGTAHSHPGSPFHSDGDIRDERKHSGLHLTCGHLERQDPAWVACLDVHGRRMKLNPEDIMELEIKYPEEWFRKLSRGIKADRICGL